MMSFNQFLSEGKRGRKSKFATHDADAEYVKSQFNFYDISNMSNKINGLRSKYLKALQNNNIKMVDAEKKSLAELKDVLDNHNVVLPKRQRNWHIHEKDIVNGINQLFKSGFFIKNGKKIEDNKQYYAENVGGSNESDVKVVSKATKNSKESSFFIECKLNLQSAEYFKFGIQIVNDKLHYDHKKFIQGDVKNDKEQVDKINKLFDKDINLDKFLNSIANSNKIKSYWKQFLKNLHDIVNFMKKNDEFKDFAKEKMSNTFPDGFKNMSQVFDKYCEYYIDKYNELIDQLFDLLTYDEIIKQRDNFKILKRKSSDTAKDNVVFNTLDTLVANIKTAEELLNDTIIQDNKSFNNIVNEIKKIEVKFKLLLEDQGLDPNNFNNIDQLKDINKMMYFFKMFVSSTGRKSKGDVPLIDNQYDEFGNMQLFPEVEITDDVLAQMITDFYVKKDNCAYIQIADTVLQFDENFNPLQIPKLPLFKNVMNKYVVKLLINDELTHIGLHISAVEMDEDELKKFNNISFKKNDSNWIKTELKTLQVS